MQIRGFQVAIGGTYVLMDDVVTALRAYAQSVEDPDHAGIVHEVASWLQAGADQSAIPQAYKSGIDALGFEPQTRTLAGTQEPPYGAEPLDQSLDIERIEVYPDPPEDPRPKWYTRSIDTGGYVMQTTGGSFDYEWVVKNAEERWPGKPIHLLKNAGADSKWTEDSTRGVFPSKGPPVRRLWAGAGR